MLVPGPTQRSNITLVVGYEGGPAETDETRLLQSGYPTHFVRSIGEAEIYLLSNPPVEVLLCNELNIRDVDEIYLRTLLNLKTALEELKAQDESFASKFIPEDESMLLKHLAHAMTNQRKKSS